MQGLCHLERQIKIPAKNRLIGTVIMNTDMYFWHLWPMQVIPQNYDWCLLWFSLSFISIFHCVIHSINCSIDFQQQSYVHTKIFQICAMSQNNWLLWIELLWPENLPNTYDIWEHWTAVSTLLGLISSVYHNLYHLRSNQRPQIAVPKLQMSHQFISHTSDTKSTSHGNCVAK